MTWKLTLNVVIFTIKIPILTNQYQQDSSKCEINSDLSFEGNYIDYYRWILNDYDAYEKTNLTFWHSKIQNI